MKSSTDKQASAVSYSLAYVRQIVREKLDVSHQLPSTFLSNAAFSVAACVATYTVVKAVAELVTSANAGAKDIHELIAETPKTGLRFAVVGTGISGTQAMKACLAEGIEVVGFEADSEIGGFWRFKEDTTHPSVYRSTHIDTDRDFNSYGDRPWDKETPLLIHNSQIFEYLKIQHKEFGLTERVRFSTKVEFVTPVEDDIEKAKAARKKNKQETDKWKVISVKVDSKTGEAVEGSRKEEIFDGVLVCTGRHGGGGFIPKFPDMDKYKGESCHSSKYKYPEKHNLQNKTVVVVGIGNSGVDIVTELGQFNKNGGKTILVSRSGGWIVKTSHLEAFSAQGPMDRETVKLSSRIPWFVADNLAWKYSAELRKNQTILNKSGLKPKHRMMQQHLVLTGLSGQTPLQDQLEKGWVEVKKDIVRFTEKGIVFVDKDNIVEDTETKVDFVIFATGYKQQAGFIDPKVVDMRFEREGNDVPLYKGCIPISEYRGVGFINFIQSITFVCSDLQSRFCVRAFKGLIPFPTLDNQLEEMLETRNALTARYIDRSQLKVQHGTDFRYYEDLAKLIGCDTSFWNLLTQRPTAFWHAWIANYQPTQWRLVGPGRLENAEEKIAELWTSRYFGKYMNKSNELYGQMKPGVGHFFTLKAVLRWLLVYALILKSKYFDNCSGGEHIKDDLEQNLRWMHENDEKQGIAHSLTLNNKEQDGFGGEKFFAYENRRSKPINNDNNSNNK